MNQGRKLLSASIPSINKLHCLVGEIDSQEVQDSLVNSWHHWRILKCRLLIHSLPDVIVSPMMTSKGSIHIVAPKELLETGEVQRKLNEMNIKCSKFMDVTQKVYEACLKYTISFKLAPEWNKVGNNLLKGKNFLVSLDLPTNAISMEMISNCEKPYFSLLPFCISVPELSLRYFSLSLKVVENFMENENGFIDLNGSELEPQVWVHVLPSFKRGKVTSISKKIPQTCSFNSYEQIKEYWKNMYGYNLPESDVGLIYYQVCFPWPEQNYYHYPSCCIKAVQPTQLFPDNGEHITQQFLQDLTERVPTIFGSTLKLQELPSRPPSDNWQKNDHKENILNQSSWVARNTNKIPNKQLTPCNSRSSANPGYKLPVNYLAQIDVNYLGALSTFSNNSGTSRLMHNVIKDKNLRDALNIKRFVSTCSTDKRILADCYEKFFPPEKKSKFSQLPSDSCIKEYGSSPLSDKPNIKVETMCSSQLIKSDSDKSQILNEISEKVDDTSLNYMLRRRSSFDLNDFCAGLDENNLSVGLLDKNIALCPEKSDIDKNEFDGPNSVLEVQSHYFTNIPDKSQCNEITDLVNTSLQQDKQSEKIKPLSKLKFNNLFGRKSKTQRTSTMNLGKHMQKSNFKTNNIDFYFKGKKQVNVSHFSKVPIKPSMPKLIQTNLTIKSGGKIELCDANKKERQ